MGTPFTVFGATGFVGSHLVRHLRARGAEVRAPGRSEPTPEGDLGHTIYCIGLTADFRDRPFDTMEAHVCRLAAVLEQCVFRSFLYLSSTRIYGGSGSGEEGRPVSVDPADPSDLYNISKLAGESLCLAQPSPAIRVARLSNVFGPAAGGAGMDEDNFLASLVRDAVEGGHIELRSSPQSVKDYIHADDVARALHRIAIAGRRRLYNVASGVNVPAGDIVAALQLLTGCTVEIGAGSPEIQFPEIATAHLKKEFGAGESSWQPSPLLDRIAELVDAARQISPALVGDGL